MYTILLVLGIAMQNLRAQLFNVSKTREGRETPGLYCGNVDATFFIKTIIDY